MSIFGPTFWTVPPRFWPSNRSKTGPKSDHFWVMERDSKTCQCTYPLHHHPTSRYLVKKGSVSLLGSVEGYGPTPKRGQFLTPKPLWCPDKPSRVPPQKGVIPWVQTHGVGYPKGVTFWHTQISKTHSFPLSNDIGFGQKPWPILGHPMGPDPCRDTQKGHLKWVISEHLFYRYLPVFDPQIDQKLVKKWPQKVSSRTHPETPKPRNLTSWDFGHPPKVGDHKMSQFLTPLFIGFSR